MKHSNHTNGFTLIELIVVIVILGIISTTAAPKFIDLQSSARIACLEGLKGAIQSANNLARSKAFIQGVDMNGSWVAKKDQNGNTLSGNPTDFEKTPFVEIDGIRYGMSKGYVDRLYITAFLQGSQGFQTEVVNGKKYAKQKNTGNDANTLCRSISKTKICEYEWCACAGKTTNDYDSEFFVPKGTNIYEATTNAQQKCYLIYSVPKEVGQKPTLKIESTGC